MRGTFTCPLRVGQRVRHTDYRGTPVTGVVYGITVDSERGLMVDCVLDTPLVLPATSSCPELTIHRQYAPVHEFADADEHAELIACLRACMAVLHLDEALHKRVQQALAATTGSAS